MKWKTLVHNGVAFPPEYEPQGFRILIRGKLFELTPFQEEMAMAWAKKKDTPYVKDPVFQKNFLKDFLAHFPAEVRDCTIDDIDFSQLYQFVDQEKEAKANLSREAKKARAQERKQKREEMKATYGVAEVDGEKYDVMNYLVEPPGIFMGRGDHPMRGRWKPRVHPKDVTLNLGEDAPVPQGDWGKIVHDHDSTWLARWIDKLTEKEKYVWLSDASKLRQERDKAKYDKAKKLSDNFEKVVEKIYDAMESREYKRRMVATTSYLIYKLAMRVGDEKDPDEADTVGASTLRVEHVKLNGKNIEFDFLGKDSVRWQKSLEVNGRDGILYKNLQEFTKGKKPDEMIFSDITSRTVNKFFGSVLRGLTAKVFRTCLATEIVRKALVQVAEQAKNAPVYEKIYLAKKANLQAAITCNHKRAIPKNFDENLKKREEKLAEAQQATPKTDKQAARFKERVENMKLQIQLIKETRDYNLGTSLRNYIDPRIVVSWCKYVGLDWTKLYTKSLQRKFTWVEKATPKWQKVAAAAKVGAALE